MNRRPILTALTASGLAVAAALAGSTSASAATLESCTINTPVGAVRVAFFTQKNGLTKTGFVEIFGARQPVMLVKDRVAWQRGAAGMVAPGRVRQWRVAYPVSFYTHASVAVKDSGGSVRGCVTH